MDYQFREIEKKWSKYWADHQIYKVEIDNTLPKYYVLDMFPYPSGAGLHVGHPLGYFATDILSRYKRMRGFNVLHPMGFDAFGLPAEQYAIETGQHPAETTAKNITRYKEQLASMGFNYDWNREVATSDPEFYRWTQWIFLQLFGSWYDNNEQKASPIDLLVKQFEKSGNKNIDAACDDDVPKFSSNEWQAYDENQKQQILLKYRLAYLAYADVNWCPKLGTVLANDEVRDGLSVRGGHPVYRKKMRQWFLRITAYAERLLNGLDTIDWPHSLKEMQRNWIGRSEGAVVNFRVDMHDEQITVFTTRPDTIFGATFMVLAPEHELVEKLTTDKQTEEISQYIDFVASRSDIDRQSEKKVTGAFTGAYAINPLTGKKIPIWIAEYVLMGYGTGAIMAVPSDDDRDHAFALEFHLPIVHIIDKSAYPNATRQDKVGTLINSGFISGMEVKDAIPAVIKKLIEDDIGFGTINYRLRDAGFSRQRYWGEPFPIIYKDGLPFPIDESELPLELPQVNSYKPTGDGEAPLANNKEWVNLADGSMRETDTMPGYAGSSWYFLRYMDPENKTAFASSQALDYWQDVDFYIGGAEHAVGHLMYARFWHKFLYDLGYLKTQEPFKKLINQGMIQGVSALVFKSKNSNTMISRGLLENSNYIPILVDVDLVDEHDVLDVVRFRNWRPEYRNATFKLEDGKYYCGREVEKMSKSKLNTVNPDEIIAEYGADTFRMYEMFLGPIELHKPWDTKGIDGVAKFLRKFWRLYVNDDGLALSDDQASEAELKILHKAIKKVSEDIERIAFNTAVSAFMICANELTSLHCNKKDVLEPLVRLIAPFAPHMAEELWQLMGNKKTVHHSPYPDFDEQYLVEDSFEYPVSVNGKLRTKIDLPLNLPKEDIEKEVLANDVVLKWMDGKQARKVVIVPGRIVNVVV